MKNNIWRQPIFFGYLCTKTAKFFKESFITLSFYNLYGFTFNGAKNRFSPQKMNLFGTIFSAFSSGQSGFFQITGTPRNCSGPP